MALGRPLGASWLLTPRGDLGGGRRRVPPTIQAACRQKNLPTSFKHLANVLQNLRPNGPTSRSGGNLGGFWTSAGCKARLSQFLIASWAALGRFLTRLGRLLGGSWTVLSANLGRLWDVLEAHGPQLGSPNRSKSEKIRCRDVLHLGIHLQIDFSLFLAPNVSTRRKPTKI